MYSPLHCKVLVVEDNPDLAANLVDYLCSHDCVVDVCSDGLGALHLATTQHFDVILLDLILPGLDGLTLCRHLRETVGQSTPILMLTARDTLEDKVTGFEAGADDYLVKPFALREVLARVRALARRIRATQTTSRLQVGDLGFDTATYRVTRAGQPISLAPIPLRILEALMRSSPRVLRREELERILWGETPPDSDALRTHLHALRSAIDKPYDRPLLHTLRGIGWQLSATPPVGST